MCRLLVPKNTYNTYFGINQKNAAGTAGCRSGVTLIR